MLRVREFSATGYRSLRKIVCPVSDLEVFVGGNGVGKTNLYRALELVRSAATNTLGLELAQEGMEAAFWAGRRRSGPARIELEVSLSDPQARGAARGIYRYHVTVGFPRRPPPLSPPNRRSRRSGSPMTAASGRSGWWTVAVPR